MMVYSMYSVQDALSGFEPPVPQLNDATAMRAFSLLCMENGPYANTKSDYSLWKVGTFDTVTCDFCPDTPTVICRGSDF